MFPLSLDFSNERLHAVHSRRLHRTANQNQPYATGSIDFVQFLPRRFPAANYERRAFRILALPDAKWNDVVWTDALWWIEISSRFVEVGGEHKSCPLSFRRPI